MINFTTQRSEIYQKLIIKEKNEGLKINETNNQYLFMVSSLREGLIQVCIYKHPKILNQQCKSLFILKPLT